MQSYSETAHCFRYYIMRYDEALFAGAERFAVVKDYGGTDLCQISFHKPPELRSKNMAFT